MTGEESGPPIDVYSLACIAYELVVGKPFHEGRTARGLMQDKLTRRVPPAAEIGAGVSTDLHELLARGLEIEPAKRLDSLASVAAWSGELDPAFLKRLFAA
jgi:serine/threonine-protein kinase